MPSAFPHGYFQPSPPELLANPSAFRGANIKVENGETFNLPFILPPPQQQLGHRGSFAGLPPPGITHPSAGYSMAKRGSLDVPALIEDKPRHHSARSEGAVAQAPAEKPSGGVSAQLDYEIKEMAEFVSTVSLKIMLMGTQATSQWKSFVTQILSSTRLPDSTILLALEYLSARMKQCDNNVPPHMNVHKLLTISLLLASKFLDDNTFQNKSWAEVTGIPVAEINSLEMEWLRVMGWNLHVDPAGDKGWEKWRQVWCNFKQEKKPAPAAPPMLAPIDTKMGYQQSYARNAYDDRHRPLSAITDRMFQLPPQRPQSTYWSAVPSPSDSPPSAPETGPPTPEYTGWPQFALPPLHYQSRMPAANFPPMYPSPYWNSSDAYHLGCGGCREPYFMQHVCGQAVVG